MFELASLLCVLLLIAYRVRRYRERAESEFLPAQEQFLERTGYRVAGRERESLRAQARAIVLGPVDNVGLFGLRTVHVPSPLVCDLGTARLTHFPPGSEYGPAGRGGWVLELRQPTRIQWSLRARPGLWEFVRPSSEDELPRWTPGHPEITLRDRELAARFEAFADDAVELEHRLTAPGLREALLACQTLDLHVMRDRVALFDLDARQLLQGISAIFGPHPGHPQGMALTTANHLRVAELLVRVAAASQKDAPQT